MEKYGIHSEDICYLSFYTQYQVKDEYEPTLIYTIKTTILLE